MPHTTDFIAPETAATLAGLFRERVRRTPQAGAYQRYSEKEDLFETVTWQQAYRLAGRWQAAFEQQGLQPGDRVAIMLRNCLEWILFDLAALGLGLVTVPLFVEDRPSNVRHILTESGARLILAPDRKRWLRIEESVGRMPTIGKIVVLDPNAWEKDIKAAGDADTRGPEAAPRTDISELAAWLPEAGSPYTEKRKDPKAPATIVYTSGTTGLPKGVMLSHANILENAFACLKRVPVYREDLFLSFLPLSHTFERTVGYYIPMMAGACVAYVRSIDKLPEDFLKVRPTVLISVPRIYERAYAKIESELENKSPIARALFRFTVDRGWRRFLYRQDRSRWRPCFLLWPFLEKLIAHRVTRAFGGRLRLSISGGAPIGLSVARVFIGLGLNFLQGYGLTETSPVISVNTEDSNDPSTVGRPLPGVETRIAGNGELLVRGTTVMSGYWRDREATDAVIDSEGYFHTGDIAETDARGRLKIVGRLKEIIVLSTGEKIPPGDLELAITENLLFEQAMIVGEGRPYLAALVVLNRKEWEKTAVAGGLPPDRADSLSGEAVESILLSEMGRMIHRFPGYAQIRRVHATFHPWRIEDGLITNTLKLRRKKLLERFSREVDALFKGH